MNSWRSVRLPAHFLGTRDDTAASEDQVTRCSSYRGLLCHPEENPLFACTLDTWSSCWTAAFSLCYSDLHWTVHRFGAKSWCVWMEKASVKGLRPARGRVVGLFDLGLRLQCSLNGADRRWGHLLSWSASASSSREGAPPHSSQLAAASHPGLEGGIKDGTAEYWKVGACWENAGLHRTLRKISFNLRRKSVYSGSKARSGDPFWGLCTSRAKTRWIYFSTIQTYYLMWLCGPLGSLLIISFSCQARPLVATPRKHNRSIKLKVTSFFQWKINSIQGVNGGNVCLIFLKCSITANFWIKKAFVQLISWSWLWMLVNTGSVHLPSGGAKAWSPDEAWSDLFSGLWNKYLNLRYPTAT